MKIYIAAIFLFLISGLSACKKDDNSEFTDIPVIESYLNTGKYLSLSVKRQIPFAGDINYCNDDVNNLEITVFCNNTKHILTPVGEGKYEDRSLIIKEGERYDLSFIYNSRTVSAFTTVPVKPAGFSQSAGSISVIRMDSATIPTAGNGRWEMPDPLRLTWENADDSYYIVVIENMEETPDPVRDFGDNEMPVSRFNKAPTTSDGIQMRPQEFQYFGKHRLILYHVLPDYASLFDENTNTSQNLTNPSSSIVNGYGIFTGLNADTLYIDVNEE